VLPDLPLTGERTLPAIAHENYWFRRHEAAYRWLAATLPVAGAAVVDAGCGEGYGGTSLVEAGATLVVGLDLDLPTLRHAGATRPGVRPVAANLVALPLAPASVDVVVCSQVVEHLWDQDAFVAECARVLRPGGVLAVTTPNRRTFPPGNIFHNRELDATELVDLVGRHLVVDQVLGLHHGARLAAADARHGDLVAAQIAQPPELRDHLLRARVAAVSADDFVVGGQDVGSCLDLVLTAVRA
jgi:2-polyprenyl-3-methyl-5-hydroxy-6-metoxy-1,4-benzoquinol methylase